MALPVHAWLFRQGDPGDALYVLRSGRLEVLDERERLPAVVRRLGPGAVVGELALLAETPRSARCATAGR